jgi:hypothetical protein
VALGTTVPLFGVATAGAFGGSGDEFPVSSNPDATVGVDRFRCEDGTGIALEGHGVLPTVRVEYAPADLAAGIDTVLEAAVARVR